MSSVCLVNEHLHAVFVGKLGKSLNIGANAVVSGVVDEEGLRIGVSDHDLLNLFGCNTQSDADTVLCLGLHVYGDRAAQNKGVDCALMDVSRKDDLVARLAGRKDHALNRTCRASDHQECMLGTECVCGKLLGLADNAHGMTQIVEGLHGVDVQPNTLLP